MKRWALLLGLPMMISSLQDARALSFGSFDSRSMAMGGAGVAAGTSANASFFNPALLAAARAGENFSLELPIIGARLSDPDQFLSSLDDYQNANYPDAFSNAVTQWNNASTHTELAAARDAIVSSGGALVNGLTSLSNKAMQVQLNAGMVVGVPSKRWGTAFYVNGRLDGGTMMEITQNDFDNINAVINVVQNLNLSGLNNSSANQLTDPTGNLTSSVQVRGAQISEAGISLAREFALAGNTLAFGITPKYVKVDTFDYKVDVDTADIDLSQGKKSYNDFNLDIGVAHDYGNNWKIGLVVKNILSRSYTTVLGNVIEIKPQPRWGLAYAGTSALVALDVDLAENKPTGFDPASQYVSFGAEWNAWNLLQLRAGYRYNINDSNASSASLGLGLSPMGIHMDLALVGSDRELGFGLQAGYRF